MSFGSRVRVARVRVAERENFRDLTIRRHFCEPRPMPLSLLHVAPLCFAPRAPPPSMLERGTPTASKFFGGTSVGDLGFDPLGLGSRGMLVPFREAEVKHGRLAMLAAVAWPLQEIFHPLLVDALRAAGWTNTRDILAETNGLSPNVLNGGLEQWQVAPVLMLGLFYASIVELRDVHARADAGLAFNEWANDHVAGDAAFDPLNIASGLPAEQRRRFQEAELFNGRIAMWAVAMYVAIEAAFKVPIVQFGSELFEPIIFDRVVRAGLDQAFRAASMDGSIDGIAY